MLSHAPINLKRGSSAVKSPAQVWLCRHNHIGFNHCGMMVKPQLTGLSAGIWWKGSGREYQLS